MIKESIKVDELGQNDLCLTKYTIKGTNPGKTVYIQANVHGAEVQGNAVIYKLVEKLKDFEINGEIILIPQANPYGANIKMGTYTHGRFNPTTGDNWNRMYLDYFKQDKGKGLIDVEGFVKDHLNKDINQVICAYKNLIKQALNDFRESQKEYSISENKNLFVTLQEQAANADIVLDLHTAGVGTRYIYSPEYLKDQCSDIEFPFYIIIPNEFGGAMDEATFNPWVRLYDEFKKAGHKLEYKFESYTVELGSEETISMSEAEDDCNRILTLLEKRGIIKGSINSFPKHEKVFCNLKAYKMYRAPSAGLCEYLIECGEKFKKGQVIAKIFRFDNLDKLEKSYIEIKAVTDGYLINRTPSAIVKKGMDLMECFTDTF